VFGADGFNFQITYLGGDGNDVVLTTVVPEPSCVLTALIPFLISGRRTKRNRRDGRGTFVGGAS
jgi:hypothetical protein